MTISRWTGLEVVPLRSLARMYTQGCFKSSTLLDTGFRRYDDLALDGAGGCAVALAGEDVYARLFHTLNPSGYRPRIEYGAGFSPV